jgi:thiol:disulfide interchange protein DsbC
MRATRLVAISVSLALAATAGVASGADDSDTSAAIRKTLQTKYPAIKIVDVQASPLRGIYEVFTGDSIAYSDATGEFLMLGSLVNTRTGENLTSLRIDERNAIDFESLPFSKAIKVVKGDGKRRIAVFADPDCPYCQELEQELTSVDDVTIYTFLYPLPIHPDAAAKARAIWCSKDKAGAWTAWMLEKRDPVAESSCDEKALDDTHALGERLRINSTPTFFLSSGKRVSGALSAEQLEQVLKEPPAVPTANR